MAFRAIGTQSYKRLIPLLTRCNVVIIKLFRQHKMYLFYVRNELNFHSIFLRFKTRFLKNPSSIWINKSSSKKVEGKKQCRQFWIDNNKEKEKWIFFSTENSTPKAVYHWNVILREKMVLKLLNKSIKINLCKLDTLFSFTNKLESFRYFKETL